MEGGLDNKIRNKVRNNFVRLCSELDNIGISLLLYQRLVLTSADLDLILDRVSRRERNIRLLQIILRKNQEQFRVFCDCLTETGREDLKKLLDN